MDLDEMPLYLGEEFSLELDDPLLLKRDNCDTRDPELMRGGSSNVSRTLAD